jgi:CheY-like chemotaxis protein
MMLERLGYSVDCRTSSIEALELFAAMPQNFDLVITDMTMPSLTGEKLAAEH